MIRAAACALLAALSAGPAGAACRQALALGLDVSGSVDAAEYRLQRDGLAAALTDPAVAALILATPDAPIRLAAYEWAGPGRPLLIVDWVEIDSRATLDALATRLRAPGQPPVAGSTDIGMALRAGFTLLDRQAECWKRTLDLSGDGRANIGADPALVRAEAPPGTTVNGLVIGADGQNVTDARAMDIKELSSYYRTQVITGPGAFVVTALGYEAYAEAMTAKLIRELAPVAIGALDPPADQ